MYACQKNFDWHAIIGSYWRSASEIHGIDDTMYNEKVLSYIKKIGSPNGTLQGTLVPYVPGVQSLLE